MAIQPAIGPAHRKHNSYIKILDVIENNSTFVNTLPNCEPQLGKRDLYPTLGSQKDTAEFVNALMWVLNMSDGSNDLISISDKSKVDFDLIKEAADKLFEKDLLKEKR